MISDLNTQLIRYQDREELLTDLNHVLEWEYSETAAKTKTKFWNKLKQTIDIIEQEQNDIRNYIKTGL